MSDLLKLFIGFIGMIIVAYAINIFLESKKKIEKDLDWINKIL
jgi:hypothetical protein